MKIDFDFAPLARHTSLVLVAGWIGLLAGCTGGENLGPVPIQKSEIHITPSNLGLDALAELGQLTARRTDGQGRPSNLNRFFWRSLDPDVVQVDDAGRVVSLSPGTAVIEVSVGSEKARVEVLVDQVPVRLAVGPSQDTLRTVGQARSLNLDARDRNGFRIPRKSVKWESENAAIVSVDDQGTVTGRGEGGVKIRVKKRGRRDSVLVVVRPSASVVSIAPSLDTLSAIGAESQLRAWETDEAGQAIRSDGFAWSSSAPGVASVSQTGLVRAIAPGVANIEARAGGLKGSARIVVRPSVESIQISPAVVSIPSVEQSVQLSASGVDSQGKTVPGSAFGWSSDQTTVALVDGSGRVTGVGVGTARVWATAPSGAKGFARVNVGQIRLNVTPRADTLTAIGDSTSFSIHPTDSRGGQAYCPNPNWRSSNTSVATVNSLGRSVAKAIGTALIVISACSVEDTASITVAPGGGSGGGGSPSTPPPPPPPPPAPSVGDPELPRLVPVLPGGYSTQVSVPAGGNLQAAINSAGPGTEILLAPGATYTGSFTLPSRGDNGWVRIATALSAPANTRVDTTLALAKVTCTGSNCSTFSAGAGSDGWELSLMEITTQESFVNTPLRLHDTGQNVPDRILLDRIYVHPRTANDRVTRCVIGNASNLTVRYSELVECHNTGQQAQAIAVWNSPGPFSIHDNHLQGSGQAIIFGGARPAPGNSPSDITIRRNWLHKPAAWRTKYTAETAAFETKDAHRMLFEGNVVEGGGFGLLLKSVDQSGACPTTCGSESFTIRRNIIRNSGGGVNMSRKSEGGPAVLMHDVLFEDLVIEAVGPGGTWNFQGSGRQMQILNAPHNLTIRGYTSSAGPNHTWLLMGGNPAPPSLKGASFSFSDVLVRNAGNFGFFTDAGTKVSDWYTTSSWVNVYGQCSSGNSPTCTASAPSGAGANMSTVQSATAGVVR